MEQETGVQIAVRLAGGSPSALAQLIGNGVTRQQVEYWLKAGQVPPQYCMPIVNDLGMTLAILRPKDWRMIWPELIGTPGAPPVPALQGEEVSHAA